MQALINTGLSGLALVIIGAMYNSIHRRMSEMEKIATAIGGKLDSKRNRSDCDERTHHQTVMNVDVIDRLARIETKMDILLNGKGKH